MATPTAATATSRPSDTSAGATSDATPTPPSASPSSTTAPAPSTSSSTTTAPRPVSAAGSDEGDELVSPLPSLRQTHETAGYRDGITAGKATSIQAGFDEGYAAGAAEGLKRGWLLGALEALKASDAAAEVRRAPLVDAEGALAALDGARWEERVVREGEHRGGLVVRSTGQ